MDITTLNWFRRELAERKISPRIKEGVLYFLPTARMTPEMIQVVRDHREAIVIWVELLAIATADAAEMGAEQRAVLVGMGLSVQLAETTTDLVLAPAEHVSASAIDIARKYKHEILTHLRAIEPAAEEPDPSAADVAAVREQIIANLEAEGPATTSEIGFRLQVPWEVLYVATRELNKQGFLIADEATGYNPRWRLEGQTMPAKVLPFRKDVALSADDKRNATADKTMLATLVDGRAVFGTTKAPMARKRGR